tara:strand:+ start:2337 stop:2672 length:336 start_codon:yes stop_codon:yes gene_type:complete
LAVAYSVIALRIFCGGGVVVTGSGVSAPCVFVPVAYIVPIKVILNDGACAKFSARAGVARVYSVRAVAYVGGKCVVVAGGAVLATDYLVVVAHTIVVSVGVHNDPCAVCNG